MALLVTAWEAQLVCADDYVAGKQPCKQMKLRSGLQHD